MNMLRNACVRTRDYLLQLPIMTWVLLGFFITFFVFFIGPIFLNPSHVMQFKQYIIAYQPIGADFAFYVSASRSWFQTGRFVAIYYPPFETIFFAPLTLLSYETGYKIIVFTTLACYTFVTLIIPRWIGISKGSSGFAMLIFVTGIVSYGLQFELERGQFNVIALAFCLTGISIFHSWPRLRWLAYLLFSISVQLKLYPAFLVFALIGDWADWKNNLKRIVGLGVLNVLALFILGLKPVLDIISFMAESEYFHSGFNFNISITSFVFYILSLDLLPHKRVFLWLEANSWILQLFLLSVFVLGFLFILRQAYRRNAKGFNPYVFLACILGVCMIPSVSFDYKLSLLPAAMVLSVPRMLSFDDGRNSLRTILLAILFAVGYSATLYSYANKPEILQNNFPALMLVFLCTVWASLKSDQIGDDSAVAVDAAAVSKTD